MPPVPVRAHALEPRSSSVAIPEAPPRARRGHPRTIWSLPGPALEVFPMRHTSKIFTRSSMPAANAALRLDSPEICRNLKNEREFDLSPHLEVALAGLERILIVTYSPAGRKLTKTGRRTPRSLSDLPAIRQPGREGYTSGLRSAVGRSASYRTELRLLFRCLTHERSETTIQTPDFRTNGKTTADDCLRCKRRSDAGFPRSCSGWRIS